MSEVIDLNSAEMNTSARQSDSPNSPLMNTDAPKTGDSGAYSCSYYARTFYHGERICVETNVYECSGYTGYWHPVYDAKC
jgi:hypothetical protein